MDADTETDLDRPRVPDAPTQRSGDCGLVVEIIHAGVSASGGYALPAEYQD